ncbi:MAG: sn-glycerol-3-phosphate ABC transporter ATP-binding protein UgpC [Phycisphaeraceae bacterium]|nr:sn-glycerol-3-phosphate ABC transporter ATP-binding protein UgpC [Phycisphaeraceae bacterium]
MSTLSLERLTKIYPGPVRAVDAASLEIADGEFVVLVGPSGCGKSTLLRMVAGLEEISDGELSIDGRRVTQLPARDRDVAMVFQSYALYPFMDVRRNLGFGLMHRRRHRGVRPLLSAEGRRARRSELDEIDRRVLHSAEMLGLEALLDRKPGQLSGGQRQRVALGRALVREPKVFLFDEPLSNLDAKLRHEMRSELRLLHRRLRATMLYVTHDQEEAMSLGDRIVVMRDGRIQQVGAPIEVYRHPVNRFVASFVGAPSMNFTEGTLSRRGDQLHFEKGGRDVAVPLSRVRQIDGGAAVPALLGVRPEHLRLGPRAGGVAARVDSVEVLGDRAEVRVEGPFGRWTLRVDADRAPREGAEMDIALDADAVHFFRTDAEGDRI